jgi:hypothetical protein
VLSLSKHERRWAGNNSAFPFILRQAQDERESLNWLDNLWFYKPDAGTGAIATTGNKASITCDEISKYKNATPKPKNNGLSKA